MKKFRRFSALLMLASLMLSGCAGKTPVETRAETLPETTAAAPETLPPETTVAAIPEPDLTGNGEEVTFGSAKSMLLYDVDNGSVVCSREPDAQVAPGGLTKLVTALLVAENCPLDEVVTVGSQETWNLPEGALNQNLQTGEELTVRDLLACVMLQSANDAAVVLAEHVAGTQAAFVEMMNSRVKELGCTDTEFVDVHGLEAEGNRTTARDMLKITLKAIQNETFREFFGMIFYTVPATSSAEKRELFNFNYMLGQQIVPDFYDPRVTGGMPIYHEDTGAGLVCTAEDDGTYIGIVLGAERIFGDTAQGEPAWICKRYGNFEEMTELLNQGIQN